MMFKSYYFKSLDSTNEKAKKFANEKISNVVIIADRQKKGKGRFDRKWTSSFGGLYMTLVLKEKNLNKVKYLTFIASLSAVNAIKKLTKISAKIKWPNDVLVKDKKICGILTETISNKENYALVGIGLNVNQLKFPKNISNKTTSLVIEKNKSYDTIKISKLIIKEFEKHYGYYSKKNYNKIIDIWKNNSHTLGKKIKVKTLNGNYIGKAINVDKDCNLILKTTNGKTKKIVEGDITLV